MRKLLVGLAVLLLAGPAVMAAVTTSGSAPTTDVEISSYDEEPQANLDVKNTPDNWQGISYMGTTFTPSPGFDLVAVTVQSRHGYEVYTSPVTATVGIYTATDWMDRTTYVEIGSGSGAMPDTMDEGTYVTVSLDSSVPLSGGSEYAFLYGYDATGDGVMDRITCRQWNSDPYADGGLLFFEGEQGNPLTTWMTAPGTYIDEDTQQEASIDMTFWLQSPEPATLALLGLGGLGLLIRRRR